MILFSLCDIPWWLLWLLPLLFAILTWWYYRNKYNKMVADYEGKIKGLNATITGLEDELAACKSKRSDLEGDLALTKGRMREMEAEMKDLKASGATKGGGGKEKGSGGKGSSSGSSSAGLSASSSSTGSSGSGKDSGGGKGSSSGLASAGLGAAASSLAGSGASKSSSSKSLFSGLKSDNLQIIEGIGPKMESVLKENGINTHAILANTTEDELRAILDKYGDKYKIIDPKSWPSQAKYASSNDFNDLIDYQKKLDAGKDNASGMTASKLEKYLIKTGAMKAFKQDDLKAIEGIGPATDKLLRENGINTWRELANTSAESIKAILSAAGSRFALGDPTTWPKQAELAADGKFDELRKYQDFLDGGKE